VGSAFNKVIYPSPDFTTNCGYAPHDPQYVAYPLDPPRVL